MANLLPKESLNQVRRFHRERFILVGSIVAIVCALVALLALIPTYAIVSAERAALADQVPLAALPESTDRDDIVRAQKLVRAFEPIASSTMSAFSILEGVLGARPSGTRLSGISIVRGEPGAIVLSGIAPSRDSINTYRTQLSKNPLFTTVVVPIGALTGSEGGSFSMTLNGIF